VAGLDIITDGELRRDNMIDYFAERLPGVQTDHTSKKFYYDFYDSVVRGKIPMASLRLTDDFKFLAAFTERATKFCITGPHSLVKRIKDEHYKNEETFAMDLARVMNMELKELIRAGARNIQIDEPYYSGFPEDIHWGVKVVNTLVEGVDAKITLHICYGNRYGKPSWAGNYRYLFPAILEARVHQLSLEFARRGGEDLELFKEFPNRFELGVGVIDVKTHEIETPEIVAERLRKALKFVPAARARGLTPNIHVTCVSKDRQELRHYLETIAGLGLENVFALTGDYPKGADAVFDLDSVQLITLMNELRQKGLPFWIAAAVSPFKYTEPDCAYQYLKLEKKFTAGADYAITQLGFDARKFRELRRYLDERNIQKPVLGNVYVLGLKSAEKMSKDDPPGCWVAPELVEKIRDEVKAKDKGEAARLERAARMIAILRGLGYAGAYIGGTHNAEHLGWIIERGQILAPRWKELAEEFTYAPKSAFYMFEPATAASRKLRVSDRAVNAL